MTVERCPNTSAWRISDIINGYLETRRYMGYTKSEAIAAWQMEFDE